MQTRYYNEGLFHIDGIVVVCFMDLYNPPPPSTLACVTDEYRVYM
jgi:hypothetical protein